MGKVRVLGGFRFWESPRSYCKPRYLASFTSETGKATVKSEAVPHGCRACTLRLLGLFGFRVQQVWALGAKVWDTLRVREPSGAVYKLVCISGHKPTIMYFACCWE